MLSPGVRKCNGCFFLFYKQKQNWWNHIKLKSCCYIAKKMSTKWKSNFWAFCDYNKYLVNQPIQRKDSAHSFEGFVHGLLFSLIWVYHARTKQSKINHLTAGKLKTEEREGVPHEHVPSDPKTLTWPHALKISRSPEGRILENRTIYGYWGIFHPNFSSKSPKRRQYFISHTSNKGLMSKGSHSA